jgi:hypothetical protein
MRPRRYVIWFALAVVLYAWNLAHSQTVYCKLFWPDTSGLAGLRSVYEQAADNHGTGDVEYLETYYYTTESDSSVEVFDMPWFYMFELRGNNLLELQRANVVRRISKHSPVKSITVTMPDDSVPIQFRAKQPSNWLKMQAKVKCETLKAKVDSTCDADKTKKRKDVWKELNKKSNPKDNATIKLK